MIYITPSTLPSSSGIMINMQEENKKPGRVEFFWGVWID